MIHSALQVQSMSKVWLKCVMGVWAYIGYKQGKRMKVIENV